MIKKKNEAYNLIKINITKLTLIQEVTGYSPSRLITLYLKQEFLEGDDPKQANELTDSGYIYFCKERKYYKTKSDLTIGHSLMLEVIKERFLTKEYFGLSFENLCNTYRSKENLIKKFAKEAFKATYPLTPEMSPRAKAMRNQRLGKISTQAWIGDILNYDYFEQTPGFMMEDVKTVLSHIDLLIMRLLFDSDLEKAINNLKSNQRLEERLIPKQTRNPKIVKIQKI